MSNSPDNGASNEEDPLKPALWSALGQITDSTLALNYGTNASPQFIGALTEMVYAQLQNTALEIEAFARHAGRTIVTTQDVMMLARKNEGLKEVLEKSVGKSQ